MSCSSGLKGIKREENSRCPLVTVEQFHHSGSRRLTHLGFSDNFRQNKPINETRNDQNAGAMEGIIEAMALGGGSLVEQTPRVSGDRANALVK